MERKDCNDVSDVSWNEFRGGKLRSISYLSGTGNTRALVHFCWKTMSKLTKNYGFTFLDLELEDTKEQGIVCFSPGGKELVKKIPFTGKPWELKDLLTICLGMK